MNCLLSKSSVLLRMIVQKVQCGAGNIICKHLKMEKIVARFVCIGDPNSTSSADLYTFMKNSKIENRFEEHMNKLVGFGSDGATKRMGKKTGIITSMRNVHPEIIGVHCLAHRLKLTRCFQE